MAVCFKKLYRTWPGALVTVPWYILVWLLIYALNKDSPTNTNENPLYSSHTPSNQTDACKCNIMQR